MIFLNRAPDDVPLKPTNSKPGFVADVLEDFAEDAGLESSMHSTALASDGHFHVHLLCSR